MHLGERGSWRNWGRLRVEMVSYREAWRRSQNENQGRPKPWRMGQVLAGLQLEDLLPELNPPSLQIPLGEDRRCGPCQHPSSHVFSTPPVLTYFPPIHWISLPLHLAYCTPITSHTSPHLMCLCPLSHMPSLLPHLPSLYLVMAVMTKTMSKPFLSHKDMKSLWLRMDMSASKVQPGSPGM